MSLTERQIISFHHHDLDHNAQLNWLSSPPTATLDSENPISLIISFRNVSFTHRIWGWLLSDGDQILLLVPSWLLRFFRFFVVFPFRSIENVCRWIFRFPFLELVLEALFLGQSWTAGVYPGFFYCRLDTLCSRPLITFTRSLSMFWERPSR